MACTREGNVSFKKLCQDREQLILTILNVLTSQCSEKINAGETETVKRGRGPAGTMGRQKRVSRL